MNLIKKGRERLARGISIKLTENLTKFTQNYLMVEMRSLELIDSDDPLEAGLEMLVSPPGKRLQSITLLSGGEQALTALVFDLCCFS